MSKKKTYYLEEPDIYKMFFISLHAHEINFNYIITTHFPFTPEEFRGAATAIIQLHNSKNVISQWHRLTLQARILL